MYGQNPSLQRVASRRSVLRIMLCTSCWLKLPIHRSWLNIWDITLEKHITPQENLQIVIFSRICTHHFLVKRRSAEKIHCYVVSYVLNGQINLSMAQRCISFIQVVKFGRTNNENFKTFVTFDHGVTDIIILKNYKIYFW